jgi:glutamate racemase
MNIGIFDSGLGGLLITKSLIKKLPEYNYTYLGDTKRVPYGNRSPETIYEFLRESVEYLFKHNCKLVIVACNTASAQALRRIQQDFLPSNYPDRKVLGVIIPTCEVAAPNNISKNIGILATNATVNSNAFVIELKKIRSDIKIIQQSAPLLVPFIENNELKLVEPILNKYLRSFKNGKIDTLILGCTHYPLIYNHIQKILGKKVKIISQDKIIPEKLKMYLLKHTEIEKVLTKKKQYQFNVKDLTEVMKKTVTKWFGKDVMLCQVDLRD